MTGATADECMRNFTAFTDALGKTDLNVLELQNLLEEVSQLNFDLAQQRDNATNDEERNEASRRHTAAIEAVLSRIGADHAQTLRKLYRSLRSVWEC